MQCYYCGASLDRSGFCPECKSDVRIWKKVYSISNRLYNEGLQKARTRDLSGSIQDLKMSLRYNKYNLMARNLLGLVYYEMGEVVNAMNEWVISKNMAEEDNPATEYLARIQKNSARLDSQNQTIKKFNQALSYCQQGSFDLAAIQLKKVLALNPKMVKAHQLNALLHMKNERYDLARRSLRHAEKIDANNTRTRRYIKECNAYLKSRGRGKASKKDTVSYQSGNDTIIRPMRLTDNTTVLTVVNLLIGAAIGIAVVTFLIIPGIRQRANRSATAQVVEANETISARDQAIKGLEDEIDGLNKQLEDAQTQTDSAGSRTKAYAALLDAYVSYADEKYTDAGEKLADVDEKLLDEDGKKIYDEMQDKTQKSMMEASMNEAMKLYNRKDYEKAIQKFTEVIEMDEGYEDYEAAYYLAYAYKNTDDDTNALQWFQKVEDETSSSSLKRQARDQIRQLEPEDNGTDADE